MNPCVDICGCYGIDRVRAHLIQQHARSLLRRIPGINIKDLRDPLRLARLVSEVDLHGDTNIHVDTKRLVYFRYLIAHPPPVHGIFSAAESAGYILFMRVGDPYNTREIIVVGADGGQNENTQMGLIRGFIPQPRIMRDQHVQTMELNGVTRIRRATDRYVPTE